MYLVNKMNVDKNMTKIANLMLDVINSTEVKADVLHYVQTARIILEQVSITATCGSQTRTECDSL